MAHMSGDVAWIRVNQGRGQSVGRLISRHDPQHWHVDFNTYGHGSTTLVAEADILTDEQAFPPEDDDDD